MIPIRLRKSLPFVEATIIANGQKLVLRHVLLDTGSSSTLLKTDDLRSLGMEILPTDVLRNVRGIGGSETVIEKTIEGLRVGEVTVSPFLVQLGAVGYMDDLDGILGIDFILKSKAVLDFAKREMRFGV